MKKVFLCFAFIIVTAFVYALDIKYAPIVNAALSDLKTNTKLSLLRGHVAVNISSGNKELDTQFAEAIKSAYPAFDSRADTVRHEDLYQMMVKVYRENDEVFIRTAVTNFEDKHIVERTAGAKSVSEAVLETLQYKTAIHAKNEFEAYLDSAFANAGDVVAEAEPLPPPPPKELPAWLKPDIRFEFKWSNPPMFGLSLSPQAFVLEIPLVLCNFYFLCQFGIPFGEKSESSTRFVGGYLLRYNEHFYIPVEIGGSYNSDSDDGFTFGAGVMKIWRIYGSEEEGMAGVHTTAKLIIGTDTQNCLTNTLMLSVGLVYK